MVCMGRSTLRAFGLLIGPAMALVIALFAGGCGEEAAVSDASTPTVESDAADRAQPTQSSYDIEAMMKSLASTLQGEEPILRKALESMDSLADAMREVLEWQAKSPGSPENLTVMRIKFGHIKGDRGAKQ
jgi:hypothetical protein